MDFYVHICGQRKNSMYVSVSLYVHRGGCTCIHQAIGVTSTSKHLHSKLQGLPDGGASSLHRADSEDPGAASTANMHTLLLLMIWAAPLSLAAGYKLFFVINQAMLVGVLWGMRRWFAPSFLSMAFVVATLTPIGDNSKMGQANLVVLFIAVLALWKRRGSILSIAAMAKMSPALYLAWWAGRMP